MSLTDRNAFARELMTSRVRPELRERAERIHALDNVYVERDKDKSLQVQIEEIVAQIMNPAAKEGFAVAVLGPSGAGKSTLVHRGIEATPEFEPMDDGYGNEVEFTLHVQTPSACTSITLGAAIVRATGYPLEKVPTESELWALVTKRLQLKMHKVIFFDEFQQVLKGPKSKGMAYLTNKIRGLLQNPEWPVWLVLAGVPDVMEFIERDTWFHMERRVRPIELDDLESGPEDIEDMQDILTSLSKAGGVAVAFPTTEEFMKRLIHGGLNRFGMSIQLMKMSIVAAILDDTSSNELRLSHFKEGYRQLSGCKPATNVFIADDWKRIQRQVRQVNNQSRLTTSYNLLPE